jgi:hypothetical protein
MKRAVAVEVHSDRPNYFVAVELSEDDVIELVEAGTKVYDLGHEGNNKKKFTWLVAGISYLPDTAVIVGAAALGLVGGAAGLIGSKFVNWVWPDKKD